MSFGQSTITMTGDGGRRPASQLLTALQSIVMDLSETPEARLSRVTALIGNQVDTEKGMSRDAAFLPPIPAAKGGFAAWRMKRVQSHIEANLQRTLSTEDLAKLCGVSVSHFSRAFRKSLGVSPHVYVLERRIERAKRLMVASRQSLGLIALECGMADQAHFTRTFKRFVGLPPAAWRRSRNLGLPDPPGRPGDTSTPQRDSMRWGLT